MQAVVFDGEEQAFQSVMKGKVSPMSVTASDTSVKELICIEYRKTRTKLIAKANQIKC